MYSGSMMKILRGCEQLPDLYRLDKQDHRWQSHLAAVSNSCRHNESIRRQVCCLMREAVDRKICLDCWLHSAMCLCDSIEHSSSVELCEGDLSVVVVVVLHADELMSTTNSGHIAAKTLDGELLVWGTDDYEREITRVGTCDANSVAVVLYPEENAMPLDKFLAKWRGGCDSMQRPTLRIIVPDSTWHQAKRVNRHIPEHLPRVVLDLDRISTSDPGLEWGLAVPLRPRTRESGVNSLEAILLALEHVLGGSSSDLLRGKLMRNLKRFIDASLVLKGSQPEYGLLDGSALREKLVEVKAALHCQSVQALRRLRRQEGLPEGGVE